MAAVDSSVRKGLAGMIVNTTSVSMVNPEANSLTCRRVPGPAARR
jgi:citrate synthase